MLDLPVYCTTPSTAAAISGGRALEHIHLELGFLLSVQHFRMSTTVIAWQTDAGEPQGGQLRDSAADSRVSDQSTQNSSYEMHVYHLLPSPPFCCH